MHRILFRIISYEKRLLKIIKITIIINIIVCRKEKQNGLRASY